MGKVIATYQVRITLRQHDEDPIDEAEPNEPPTIAVLEEALLSKVLELDFIGSATVDAERVDL